MPFMFCALIFGYNCLIVAFSHTRSESVARIGWAAETLTTPAFRSICQMTTCFPSARRGASKLFHANDNRRHLGL